jgi:6,7-dimethyl-8-ribityllumazine synthase
MSNAIPSRPRQFSQRRTVAIVASQYNSELVDGLTSHAQKELAALMPDSSFQIFQVPGAFEIPLLVQEVAEKGGYSAIIALGVIIQGETQHARLVGEEVTRALLDISLRFKIPVIHEVLLLENEAQARERCLQDEINRGTESARVAVRMVQAMSELKAQR